MTCKLSRCISPAFNPVHQAIRQGKCTEAVLYGGRGCAKSSFVSLELLLELITHEQVHGVILRKRENRLRTSVFTQMQWAISMLGLDQQFKLTVSPMEMTYLPTGQKLYFFGMDDPGKIKSIKAPFGHIGLLWFEELDQFSGPEEIRSVEQSVLRGGDYSMVFKTFNPPQSPGHWVNQEVLEQKPGRICCKSSYLDVPPQWLGKRFLDDADFLRTQNPKAYDHEYLGNPNGTGGQVFHNVTVRPIEEEERQRLDWRYRGIDWGWYPDPFCYVELSYLPQEQKLFILDEVSGCKLPNEKIVALLREHGVGPGDRITADSGGEGVKSAADLRGRGLDVHPAVKGPGSVSYSMKWLASLGEIIIDPERCPRAAREFTRYEFERGPGGEFISGFPDRDNHAIDAVRYGMEKVWRRPFRRNSTG